MIKEVITITKAAEYLNVHINTLRNWIKKKQVRVINTPGGHYRMLKSDLVELMKRYNFPIPPKLITNKYIIYLIDDDENIIKVYKQFFKRYQEYELYTFNNGFDALFKIESIKPNLILLDIFMPKMNGLEFARKVKENEELKNVKIIAISSDKAAQEGAMLSRIDDFYFKGDDLTFLLKKVNKVFKAVQV